MTIDAVILAAGIGNRLGKFGAQPKSLLEFGGLSLLARHLDNLAALAVRQVTICVGYRQDLLLAELSARARIPWHCVGNPDFRSGSIRSLWTVREALRSGSDILLMDADVLYTPALLRALVDSPHGNCLLLDRDLPPGDEPVKIGVRNGRIVEFTKHPDPAIALDFAGESVGFFKFGPAAAAQLAASTERYIDAGRQQEPYEEAIRDLVQANAHPLGFEDVTGLPWIEIDFPEDIKRAREEILPSIAP